MQKPDRSKAWGLMVRIAALGVGGLLLAGCATGYSFVQPETAGSGGYYTGAEPYSGQGYYDFYGTGPYYPGTSGWGYYNGTWPYSNAFGWYGGGYGYGPQLGIGIGISNVWDYPGYWGPWYSTGFPIWSCAGPGCGRWRHHRHHRRDQEWHHHDGPDPSPKVVLKPERPPVRLRMERDGAPTARPLARRWSVEGFPARRSPEPTDFASHDFVRAPIRRPVEEAQEARFDRMPARPAYVPRVSEQSAFANPRGMSAPVIVPRAAHRIGQPSYRPQPVHAAPVAPPHNARATKTEIP